jgi:hypothetical protein
VEWLAVTVVGFLAATGLVIVLGRRTTAPWERKKKRLHTRRRTVAAGTPPAGALARLRDVVAQQAAAVLRGTAAARKPLERGVGALGAVSKRWRSPGRPVRQAEDQRAVPIAKRARVSLLLPRRQASVRRRRALRLIRRRAPGDDSRVARRR